MWFLFFFNDAATTEIYTLSLHDALPICRGRRPARRRAPRAAPNRGLRRGEHLGDRDRGGRPQPRCRAPRHRGIPCVRERSEEHTSELQSRQYLVCRLLLEKKNNLIPRTY